MMMRRNIVAGLLLAASLACGTAAHAQPVTISYQ